MKTFQIFLLLDLALALKHCLAKRWSLVIQLVFSARPPGMHTRNHITLPKVSFSLRYVTAHQWWSWIELISCVVDGLKQRLITNFSKLGSSINHAHQLFRNSLGILSSQLSFKPQSSCRIFFADNTNGTTNPKGS